VRGAMRAEQFQLRLAQFRIHVDDSNSIVRFSHEYI